MNDDEDDDERRRTVKLIITSNVDLTTDYQNNTLIIKLHSLSAKRFSNAAFGLTKIFNETEIQFPGTI